MAIAAAVAAKKMRQIDLISLQSFTFEMKKKTGMWRMYLDVEMEVR